MNTLLEDPPTPRAELEPVGPPASHSAHRIRHEMAAVRLSVHWPGTRKTLSPDQKTQAADTFGAEGKLLSAGKRIVDTKHPAWRACTQIRSRANKLWQAMSLPWPEPGIRLIRRDDIETFDGQANALNEELASAVQTLDVHYDELKTQARRQLGELYDPTDYPLMLVGSFTIAWDFPSVEAPAYLRDLCPDLYREEQERVRSRFEEAARLAEEAFVAELSGLVSHLAERLGDTADGKPKVFRDSAIGNLTAFFERFRKLNVTENATLDDLVDEATRIVGGVEPQHLRDRSDLRSRVAADLAPIRETLDGMIVERPRRRVIRG